MDAFYVSVELRRRPELRGQPVIVAGTGPRAVVTTASYEARRFGVGSAMPAARARRLCPDGVYLQPDFAYYREASREVMALVRACSEHGRGGRARRGLPRADRPAGAARRDAAAGARDRADTGLGCSIGIGPNKLVAKVASDAEKPRGFVVLTAEQARARFAQSPRADPGDRPQDGRAPAGIWDSTRWASWRPPRRNCSPPGSAPGSGRRCSAARVSRTTPRHRGAQGGLGVPRDHVRLRHRRPGHARADPPAAHRAALRDAGGAAAPRPDDRDQGPPGRLLHPHPRAHAARAGGLGRPRAAGGARPAASLRAPRPVRLLGVRVAGLEPAAPTDVEQLTLRSSALAVCGGSPSGSSTARRRAGGGTRGRAGCRRRARRGSRPRRGGCRPWRRRRWAARR